MAKALPLEHWRSVYRGHQEHCGRFGVTAKDFNVQVAARLGGHPSPGPQLWCSYAWQVAMSIAGHRCCPKAVGVPCMCEVSYTCPDHGTRCVGSHD